MATSPKVKEPVQEDLLQPEGETPPVEKKEEAPQIEAGEAENEKDQIDPSEALRKQVEALRKSEEINKRRVEESRLEAEKAHKLAQERAAEVISLRKETLQSQLDTISTALTSAQNEAESAKRDLKTAINTGDVDAQADAYERLAAAKADVSQLSNGKLDLESRVKAAEQAPAQEAQPQNQLPDRIQRWIRAKNPDQETWDKLRAYHWEIIREGIQFDSDEYIEAAETRLGWRRPQKREERVERMPENQGGESDSSFVSAPVSRESISPGGGSTQIRLTAAQREAAKIAGVTEKEYAIQLQNLQRAKANGSYGGQP